MAVAIESITRGFTKYHLNREGEEPWPFRPVIHKFTEVDGPYPHDHPWSFTSYVVRGGYVEEVYCVSQETGLWSKQVIQRKQGDSFTVPATHIHRIAELLAPEVWTFTEYGPWQRQPRLWHCDPATGLLSSWEIGP